MLTGPLDVLLQAGADALLDRRRERTQWKENEQGHAHALEEMAAKAGLDDHAAQRAFERSQQAEEHAAGFRVWEQVTVQAELMRQEASPFRLPENDIRLIVEAATRKGELPALIVAPFLSEAGTNAGPDVGRQIWWRIQQRAGWTASLASVAGHMRPVSDLDIDLSLIRRALGDMPFVLVHGDVEADQVALRIVGSGMLRCDGAVDTAVSICGTLPRPDQAGNYRLAGDALDTVVACAGALGEVFRLTRWNQLPQLHKRVPAWLRPGVTAIVIGGYGIAVENFAAENSVWDADVVSGLQDLVVALPADDQGVRGRAQTLLNEVMSRVAARGLRAG